MWKLIVIHINGFRERRQSKSDEVIQMNSFAPDYIQELALIETSRQQREAIQSLQYKPKKDSQLQIVLWKMKDQ